MSDQPISTIFNITPRYLRSVNLERDFNDPRSLENYILTPHGSQCLGQLALGLRKGGTERAWRFTGNYGSGKSSFALLVAHWFSGNARSLKSLVGEGLRYEAFGVTTKPRYVPVLVTGSREPMGRAILRAVVRVMDEQYSRGIRSALVNTIERAVQRSTGLTDTDVVDWVIQCNAKLIKDGKAGGILILLDELGKFLEYAAFHPQQQDVFLLQKLGEAAATSGDQPLFLVGLLHQSFDAYADSLDQATQREWEKIAGRFQEVVFNQPLAQIAQLAAAAIHVREQFLTPAIREEAQAGMEAAFDVGWMGSAANRGDLIKLAPKVFPLHATVLPVLVRTFIRFGQNERSLFNFLLSNEPFGLQDFAHRPLAIGNTYRLPDFYDYVRANFGHRLSVRSYRSHWTEIESMVDSFATSDPLQLSVVKTVGILNLLDEADLAPTDKVIQAALGGQGGFGSHKVRSAIEGLHKSRRILFRRGVSGSYCLWPHTSVDLETQLHKATKSVPVVTSVGDALKEFLETRPIVARRHYIQTGNLRYFDVRYCSVADLEKVALQPSAADGLIVVALCENLEQRAAAEAIAQGAVASGMKNLLIAVPHDPLVNLAGLVVDAQRWDWVALNTHELTGDRFAREEVTRQKNSARQRLERRVQDLLGLRSLEGGMALRWFRCGCSITISSTRELLGSVSEICDDLYNQAPLISNELINRRNLSSAAAAARMRLIEHILTSANKPYLGMDETKKPPEMSMYLSILKRGRVHREDRGTWRLVEPAGHTETQDPCRILPTFRAIRAFLDKRGDARVKVSELFTHLGQPPWGIHGGLAPLFLALFAVIHADDVAFYEDNTFLREVRGDEFMRMSKAPTTFDVQLCRIVGIRSDVFELLLRVMEIASPADKSAQILDVVRPLCQFVAQLPNYARNTRRLSSVALAVRDVILAAKEPVKLLFQDLPIACEMKPFPAQGPCLPDAAKQFAVCLRTAIDELRTASPGLMDRMRDCVRAEFSLVGDFVAVRDRLAARAEPLVVMTTDPRLKALCLRFTDRALVEEAWLESLGSLVALQPPSRWRDSDEDTFNREMSAQAQQFRNLESIAFKKHGAGDWAEAFRLALTKEDGSEAQEVVYVEKEERAAIDQIAEGVRAVLGSDRRLGMAAISKVVWQYIGKH